MQNIRDSIEKFSKVRVLIVGDVMLDRYLWGSVSRISPEAPVPVVKLEKTSVAAGGAANVAVNVVGLGAQTYLVGLVGKDHEADNLRAVLEKTNVAPNYLISLENRETSVKTRIIAHSQQVVRLDQESINPVTNDEISKVLELISEIIDNCDIVILSDYAKGFLTEELLLRLITYCNGKNKKVLVDPKGKDYSKYKNATLLTPNRKEATDACGLEEADENAVEKAGKILLDTIASEAVLITQGERGMTLFQKAVETIDFDSLARKVYDVTGAGDTVIATLAVGIGAGLDYYEAAKIANIAAGLVVEQVGTTAITGELLKASLEEMK